MAQVPRVHSFAQLEAAAAILARAADCMHRCGERLRRSDELGASSAGTCAKSAEVLARSRDLLATIGHRSRPGEHWAQHSFHLTSELPCRTGIPAEPSGRLRVGFGRLLSVLVVEDDLILRHSISSYLRWIAGFHAHEARSGEEALALLRTETVDVLFTDIQLTTDVSGWDVADAARAARADIPVIYASGNPPARERQLEGSLFFDKPYDPDEIARACTRLAGH